jgi:hypothetical protein
MTRIICLKLFKMKILMMIPCWHRPEIVAMFVQNLRRNLPDYAEIIPYFVLSPEDPDCEVLTRITDGYDRTFTTNTPLGRKKNMGLSRAVSLEWDYMMDMGSDDIFTAQLWAYLKPYILSNAEYFGILHTYSYNPYLNKAVYMPNYHISYDDNITAQGQGRCVRRDVVEKCMPLWDSSAPFGMDGYSNERIENGGFKCQLIDNGRDPLVCQIKTYTCLTCWEQLEELCQPTNVEWVKDFFNLDTTLCYDLRDFDNFYTTVYRVSNEVGSRKDAFNLVNEAYKSQTGNTRFSSYDSFKTTVSRKLNKQ